MRLIEAALLLVLLAVLVWAAVRILRPGRSVPSHELWQVATHGRPDGGISVVLERWGEPSQVVRTLDPTDQYADFTAALEEAKAEAEVMAEALNRRRLGA